MAAAKEGDTVNVHYTGKLNDGTVFDSSKGQEPLQFTIGEGQVIQGFEEAVMGMNTGENKTITIKSDQAYGEYRSEMVVDVDRDQIPENINPEVGQQLQIDQQNGHMVVVTVTEVTENSVKLDANHPLAGKDLTFELELVEICDQLLV